MKLAQKTTNAPLFLALTALPAVLLAVSHTPASLRVLDVLTGILALGTASAAAMRLALDVSHRTSRGLWRAAVALLLLVAIAEMAGPWTDALEHRLGLGAAASWAVLVAATLLISLAVALDRIPAWPARALWGGLVLHLVATGLGAGDHRFGLADGTRQAVGELAEFLALQFYLLGVLAFVTALRWRHLTLQQSPMALGDIARSMFSTQALLHKYRYPRTWAIALPGAKTVLSLGRFFICFFDCAPTVRSKFGIGYWDQFKGICTGGFRHGLDARAYYLFELYRPEQMRRAGGYVTRYETKNGLFKILTWQLPKHKRRTSLGDKLAVHEMCERNGIPTPSLLGVARKGEVKLLCDSKIDLDRDLFVKLAKAKGSRGVERFKRIGLNRYRDQHGKELTLEQVLARLAERSRIETLMIQPHIANHPGIADFARESLITVRVITCLDAANQPAITHGFLRVVSKLESDWPHKIELGSAIDLATGALDLMTGDKEMTRFEWYRDHPVTGAPVAGRTLPFWEEVKSVALAAHRACPDRLIVGWDIAVSPQGPILLEGNAYADVDFLQRVHRCGLGASPVGPLLYARLLDLQRRIETGTVRGANDYD